MGVESFLPVPYSDNAYPSMKTNLAAKRKDENEIIRAHEKLIVDMAGTFGPLAEDLAQEGRIALLRAAKTWRGDNGATLWTYARRFVFAAMIRYKSAFLGESHESFDDQIPTRDDAEAQAAVAEGIESLSITERQVVQLVLEGHTFETIGAAMKVSDRSVRRIFANATDSLRTRLA